MIRKTWYFNNIIATHFRESLKAFFIDANCIKEKASTGIVDEKIEQQKDALNKVKMKYEVEKESFAESIKFSNEVRKEELMAFINRIKSN